MSLRSIYIGIMIPPDYKHPYLFFTVTKSHKKVSGNATNPSIYRLFIAITKLVAAAEALITTIPTKVAYLNVLRLSIQKQLLMPVIK